MTASTESKFSIGPGIIREFYFAAPLLSASQWGRSGGGSFSGQTDHPALSPTSRDQTSAGLRSVCDPLALLTIVFHCLTMPAVRSMLLKLRFRVNSNPIAPTINLLSIRELRFFKVR